MEFQREEERGFFADCCAVSLRWLIWCTSCGQQQSYSQAFLDDRQEGRTTSVTSSPCQAPTQATSSGVNEASALLHKSTELNTTGTRQGIQPAAKTLKWAKEDQGGTAMLATPKKGEKDAWSKNRNASGISLASEEGEFCSTCLEPYTKEHPAILTQCNHHFHLSCIYEWLERKQTCPLCEREMSFEEILQ